MPIVIKRRKKDDKDDDNKKSHTESKKKGRSKNSKNLTGDETNQRVEKIDKKVEKVKSSTETPGDSGESGKSGIKTPETPDLPGLHSKSVNDYNKSNETEKFVTQETIKSSDGRKVKISVYRIGEEEKIIGDKVVRRAKLKFVISYSDTVRECVDDCTDAIKEVAKATSYKVSKGVILKKIAELRDEYADEEEIPLIDYVRQKYPDKLSEIEKDPFNWILQRTKEIVGYDRLKILTFLAIVSSRMERVMGMSRLHIMLVGGSGAGKSTTIKSVTRFIESSDIYISITRLTQNALGYLNVETLDGKIIFIDQIDRQIINYLREMMTEEKICTLVTQKFVDAEGNERFKAEKICTPGQAVVITTSVADTVDVDREQLFNRFLKVYVDQDVDDLNVKDAIWMRRKSELSDVDKLVFIAYLLSRPKYADVSSLLSRARKFILQLQGYTRESLNRVTEILRNLVIAVAIARGKTKADDEDFQFVMDNFQLDILYNGLGLTERDVKIIQLLPDDGGLKASEIADELHVSKQYIDNLLKNLERKGIVESEKTDGKTFEWYLTGLGRKIKSLLSNINGVIIKRDENGKIEGIIDEKFRNDSNGGDNLTDAMSRDDTGTVSRGDEKNDRSDKADLEEKIKRFEECTGFDIGENAKIIAKQNVVTEEDLMKMFKNQYDVVAQITRCLHELDFVDKGNGVYKKMTGDDKHADFKCTTVWYQRRREELKGKTVKVREIDPDLLFCLKRMKHVEWIDNETIRVI